MAALLTCSGAALTNFHTSLLVPVFLFFFFFTWSFFLPPYFFRATATVTTRIRTRLRTALNAHSYTHVHNWRAFGCCCTYILLVYDCFFLFYIHTYTYLIVASLLFKASRFTPRFVGWRSPSSFLFCGSEVKRVEAFPLHALFSFLISAFLIALAFYFLVSFFFSVFFFSSLLFIVFGLFRFDYRSKNRVLKKAKTKIVGIFLWAFVPRFRVHSPLTNSSLFNYNNFKCVFFFNLFFPLFSFYRQLEQCYAAQSAGAQTHAHAYV